MLISRQGGGGGEGERGQGGHEARASLHTHYSIFLRIKEKKRHKSTHDQDSCQRQDSTSQDLGIISFLAGEWLVSKKY